jgi:hypothetical protein
VNAIGTAVGVAAGFTASWVSAGHYRVTFNPPFSITPVMSVSLVDATIGLMTTVATPPAALNPGSALDVMVQDVNGTANDCGFHFIALGPP